MKTLSQPSPKGRYIVLRLDSVFTSKNWTTESLGVFSLKELQDKMLKQTLLLFLTETTPQL